MRSNSMKIENKNVIELKGGQRYMGSDIKYVFSDSTLDTLIYINDADVQGELSDTERAILSAVYPTYKYIARDKDGELFVYKVKPVKNDTKYCCDMYTDYSDFKAFNHLFKFVSWGDENPHQIVSLLY